MKILVVEDKKESRYLLEYLLRGNGYEVVSAQNGIEALEHCRKGSIDLIVSDILMPKMDGFELCRCCKSDSELRKIPFLVYTATYTTEKDRAFALSIGADGFLVKPQEPEELLDEIAGLLSRKEYLAEKDVCSEEPLDDERFHETHRDRLTWKLEEKITALDETERIFQNIFQSANDAIFIHDLEGRILEVNEVACARLGYSRDQLQKMAISDIDSRKYADLSPQRTSELLESGSTMFESEHIAQNDIRIPIEVSAKIISFRGEKAVLSLARDISERKAAETELHKINRTLKVLSGGNQAMLKALDEPGLMDRICRILIEDGGYAFAWVGYALKDEKKNVKPAAWAGGNDGYLDEIKVTWDDSEFGNGPTGTAVKTRKPVVMRDLESDPSYAPWREQARKRGFASSAAFPLFYDQETIGSLNIYSNEKGSFDSKEIGLLNEFASDLSFGIASIRTRVRHDESVEALRKSEEKHRRLFETMAQGVIYQDADGKIISANPSAERILGLTLDQMQGRTSFDPRWKAIHEDGSDFPGETHPSMIALESGEEVSETVMGVFHPTENTFRWISIHAVPIFRPGESKPFQVYTTFDDITESERAKADLQRSERMLSEAQSLAHIGNWTVEFPNERIIWSDEMYRIFGVSSKTFDHSAEAFIALIHPDDRASMRRWIGELISGANPTDLEFRTIRPNGEIRVLSGRGNADFDAANRPIRAIGIAQDITERKLAEKALRDSEERYRMLVENQIDAVCRWLPDTTLTFINEGHRKIFEAPKDEIVGKKWIDFVEEPQHSKMRGDLEIWLQNPENRSHEHLYINNEGKVRWLLWQDTPIWGENGQLIEIQSVGRDITDLKHTEESLRIRENQQRALLNNIPDIAWLKDSESRFIAVNEPFARACGRDIDDVVGKTDLDIWPEDLAKSYRADDREVIESGTDKRVEEPLEGPDGDQVWIDTIKSPILNEKGDVIGTTGIARDITEHKKTEAKIRQLSDTVEAATVSVGISALDGTFTYVNNTLCDTFGYARDELIGRPVTMLDADDSLAPVIVESMIRDRKWSGEVLQRKKDGTTFPALLSIFMILDEKKEPQSVVAFVNDITDQKEIKAELHESGKKLSNAVEMAKLGHWEYDVDKDLFTFNDQFYKLFYTTAEKIGGYTMSSDEYARRFVHPDDMALVGIETRKAVEADDPKFNSQIEHRIIYADGSVGHVAVRFFIVKDDKNRTVKTYGVNQDITERKKAEDAIRMSAVRWANTFDAISDIVCIISLNNEILEMNDAGCKAVGLPKEKIIGKKCYEVVHGTDSPIPVCPCLKTQETNQPEKTTYSNEGRHMELAAWPMLGKDGKLEGIVHIVKDVTQDVEREKEKEKLEEQLQQAQKMEAIGRLAGGVAHDFNNILTAITGFSDLLYDSLAEGDPLREDVDQIMQAAQSAASLTQQLLAFSRKQIISPRVVNLNKAVVQSEKMLKRIIGEDIELKFMPGDNLWKVKIDPGQVDQLLINLAVNSRDAMPDTGNLTVETTNVTLDEKSCQSCSEFIAGQYVMLAVSDNGAGMDEKTLKNIFEPFFTTKEKGKGTGLGLATVHGIAHQNDGHINVYSEPGMGTTFKIYLPRVKGESEVDEEPAATENLRGEETILLVEDQEIVRKLAKRVLENRGYNILEADDGGEASIVCEEYEGEIDLLLTDVVMPRMNGRQLYERMAKMRPGLKVLFMSGYTENAIAHHGVLEEGTNFIQKPFRPQDLAQKVRQVLESPAPPASQAKAQSNDRIILVVDDEEMMRELYTIHIGPMGYEVICAPDGKRGLEAFKADAERISLVILDQSMPDMNGTEILRRIRELKPDIPAIISSGFGSDEIAESLAKFSNVHMLPKPFMRKDVELAIAKALPKKK